MTIYIYYGDLLHVTWITKHGVCRAMHQWDVDWCCWTWVPMPKLLK
jgi:hypothetical protein